MILGRSEADMELDHVELDQKEAVSISLDQFYSPEGDWLVAAVLIVGVVLGILPLYLGLGLLAALLVMLPFLVLIALMTIRVGGYRLVDQLLLWWSILLWIWRDGTPYAGRILPPEGGELRFL